MLLKEYFFIESLGSLYTDVQSKEIFSDSKFFVDCVPIFSSGEIIAKYDEAKLKNGFDLKKFVSDHFIFPAEAGNDYHSANNPVKEHLEELWDVLKRTPANTGGTLISLPHDYIIPGGRFREIYYWDSYFTMLGLQVSKRFDTIQHMVDNFAFLIDTIGFVPNGNRTYYLGRSQPPFFALMVKLLSEEKGEAILLQYQSQLEKEYSFWMDGASGDKLSPTNNTHRRVVLLPDGSRLNRYWDDNDIPRPEAYIEDIHIARQAKNPSNIVYRHIRAAAESGWDFSSRWFKEPGYMHSIQTTDIIPIDLNCLILYLEQTLLHIYIMLNDEINVLAFQQRIQQRKKAIDTYCWDEEKGFYFDYHHIEHQHTSCFSLAAMYPLFFSLATAEQAKKVARIIEDQFLQAGGVITTLNKTIQQWDAPNGWAPLQWITYNGLKKYSHHSIAEKIKHNWMQANERVYAATGKMMEKYNVMDTNTKAGGGEYPNQDGFGWTNGVYLALMNEI